MRVVIAGGTGFIGRALVREFGSAGYEVVVLSRGARPVEGARSIGWDGAAVGEWARELEGAQALVNVVGESVFRRWNAEGRRQILDSRIEPTATLGAAVVQAARPPRVWVNGTAVGYYGSRGDEELDEAASKGEGFLADVVDAWEQAQEACSQPHTRQVRMRIGLPFGWDGGSFPMLVGLTRRFLGSAVGNGRQWMPWLHLEDLAAAFRWCVERELEGPVNAASPYPVRNARLMAELRRRLRRPWVPPAPAFALRAAELFGGPPAEAALSSVRAVPRALLASGFEFKYPHLEGALEELLARPR